MWVIPAKTGGIRGSTPEGNPEGTPEGIPG